jgi:hypothetical protein
MAHDDSGHFASSVARPIFSRRGFVGTNVIAREEDRTKQAVWVDHDTLYIQRYAVRSRGEEVVRYVLHHALGQPVSRPRPSEIYVSQEGITTDRWRALCYCGGALPKSGWRPMLAWIPIRFHRRTIRWSPS